MKNMKLFKKLCITAFMMTVAFVALVSSTYAWFSMNNTAAVSGMELTAAAEGNLVVNGKDVVPAKSTKIAYEFTDGVIKVKPVTYETGNAWQIPASYTDINFTTGSPDTTLKDFNPITDFKESKEDSEGVFQLGYYKDYVVYLASNGEALENQTLSVNLALLDTNEMFKKALAVAFYVAETPVDNSSSYVAPAIDTEVTKIVYIQSFYTATDGVYNWSAQTINSSATDGDTKTYVTIKEGVTIPSCQVSNNGLCITMRVFFDGVIGEKQQVYTEVIPNWTYVETADTVTEENYGNYYDANGLGFAAYDETATYYEKVKDVTGLYVKSGDSYAAASAYEPTATYYSLYEGEVAYINSANLPVKSLGLTVVFKAE